MMSLQVIQSAGGFLDKYLQSGHLHQNEKDRGQLSGGYTVDWISGCAILVKRQVIEQIGMLDERFFYYWDEIDWCLRARKQGWENYCAAEAKLWHKGVQRDYHPSPNVTYYATRNRFLFLAKHAGSASAWGLAFWQTIRTILSWTLRKKWQSMQPHRDAMWQGLIDYFRKSWGIRPA